MTNINNHNVCFDRTECMLMLLSMRIGSNEMYWIKYGLPHMMFIFFLFQLIKFFVSICKEFCSIYFIKLKENVGIFQ